MILGYVKKNWLDLAVWWVLTHEMFDVPHVSYSKFDFHCGKWMVVCVTSSLTTYCDIQYVLQTTLLMLTCLRIAVPNRSGCVRQRAVQVQLGQSTRCTPISGSGNPEADARDAQCYKCAQEEDTPEQQVERHTRDLQHQDFTRGGDLCGARRPSGKGCRAASGSPTGVGVPWQSQPCTVW